MNSIITFVVLDKNNCFFGIYIKNNLCHSSTQLVSDFKNCHTDSIVKFPFGLSGSGHYFTSYQEKVIAKKLSQTNAVNESLLERQLDLSSFFDKGEKKYTYINEVDDHFQYKGSLFGKEDFPLADEYFKKLEVISLYVTRLGYNGPYSVDSFIYLENHELKLYMLTEINVRKTMGYSAATIGSLYFTEAKFVKFGIFKNQQDFDHQKIKDHFNGDFLLLSPNGNRFHSYTLGASSEVEVAELEKSFADNFIKTL